MNLVANYDWSLVWEHRSELLHGMLTALEVAAVALVISTAIGLLLALARMGKPPLSWLAVIYINVFRGVPALVSVIWVYFGVSLIIGISFSVFQAGVIALDAALQRLHRGDLPLGARRDPAGPAGGGARARHPPRAASSPG